MQSSAAVERYRGGSEAWSPGTRLIVNGVALSWAQLSSSPYMTSLLRAHCWSDLGAVLQRLADGPYSVARVRIPDPDGTLHRVLLLLAKRPDKRNLREWTTAELVAGLKCADCYNL
jgi:hypothetical protein